MLLYLDDMKWISALVTSATSVSGERGLRTGSPSASVVTIEGFICTASSSSEIVPLCNGAMETLKDFGKVVTSGSLVILGFSNLISAKQFHKPVIVPGLSDWVFRCSCERSCLTLPSSRWSCGAGWEASVTKDQSIKLLTEAHIDFSHVPKTKWDLVRFIKGIIKDL